MCLVPPATSQWNMQSHQQQLTTAATAQPLFRCRRDCGQQHTFQWNPEWNLSIKSVHGETFAYFTYIVPRPTVLYNYIVYLSNYMQYGEKNIKFVYLDFFSSLFSIKYAWSTILYVAPLKKTVSCCTCTSVALCCDWQIIDGFFFGSDKVALLRSTFREWCRVRV